MGNVALAYKRYQVCRSGKLKKAEISTKIKTCINLAAMYGVNFPDRKVYCNENDLL